jgi:hypothetical protein
MGFVIVEGDMWRVWGRKEGCIGCWWGNLRERGRWGDPDVDGRIILRWILRKLEGVVGTGKMRGISWLAATTGQLLKKDSAPRSK